MIRLVIFDLDGTLTLHNSSWWRLHEAFGTQEQGRRYYNAYFDGSISYDEWARLDAGLWKGKPLSAVDRIVNETQLMPGAIETVQVLKDHDIDLAIISGGIDVIAEPIAKRVGIDHLLVNRLLHHDGVLTGGVEVTVGWGGKTEEIKHLSESLGIPLIETAFVGDGKNDIPAFSIVGLPIAINPESPEVEEAASVVIKDMDLRKILPPILNHR